MGRGTVNGARTLGGVLSVFNTPYHEDESIDYAGLERQIDWVYEHGGNGVVMAMVSETIRLSSEERDEVAAAACRLGRDRGVVVISVGAESGHTAERHARHAAKAGADAVIAIPPISIGVDEGELHKYYTRIFGAIDLPVIVQDASNYVGQPMSIDFQSRLLNEYGDRVLFKPEASPMGPRLTALREATGGRARVFEGSGGIGLVDSYRRGVVGTMPGVEIVGALVALWRALEAGDEARIYALSQPISALVALEQGLDGFIAVEKYLLFRQGIIANTIVRGPVGFELDEETRAEVDRLFDYLMRVVDES
ncbi:MAG: dihydrodipicolinate synthase family protein [Planctomycetaceae bacterium]|nr:dihydrodipicolinate synthase family protein [Planctomycetaceae bacterium]